MEGRRDIGMEGQMDEGRIRGRSVPSGLVV